MCLQIPGGWLTDKVGGRWFYGGGVLILSVVSLLTPAAAGIHISVLMVLRIIAGMSDGIMPPAVQSLFARWSEPRYRSIIVSIKKSGANLGTCVGLLVTGILCDSDIAGGWPAVFYLFGIIGLLWCVVWYLFCYSSPGTHPCISKTERQYWESVTGTGNVARPPAPWGQILTSVPVWAMVIAGFAQAWGFFTIQTCVPLYMYDVLGFNMTKNGLFSGLPFLVLVVFDPLSAFLTDWLRAPGRLSTNVVRKSFVLIGFVISCLSFIFIMYTGCNRVLAVMFLCLAVSGAVMSLTNIITNVHDLAPLHAGKLIALGMAGVSMAGIGGPLVVGELTHQRSTYEDWRTVFFICAVMYVVGATVFSIFGSTERQSWAEPQKPAATTKE